MTETAVEPAAAEIAEWLARFEQALAARRRRGRGRAVRRRQLSGATSSPSPGTSRPSRAAGDPGHARAHARRTCSRAAGATTEPPTEADGVTEAWIAFETAVGRGSGHLRLRDGKAWTLLTTLTSSRATRSRKGDGRAARAPSTARPATARPGSSSASARRASSATRRSPYVVIVGGGQGGIALGARLRQLGVPTIIVERNARPGDSWRKRYKSLCLHDPVWYDHLPYIKFPENWPVFSPKDKIGDWLEMYTQGHGAQLLGLDRVPRARRYDEEAGEWTRRRRARRRASHAAAEAARPGDGHVRQARRARDPGHGRLQGRPAPLLPAPGTGRLRGQAGAS